MGMCVTLTLSFQQCALHLNGMPSVHIGVGHGTAGGRHDPKAVDFV